MEPTEPPSEEHYQAMLDRTEQLVAEFTESRQFEGLTRHQQREAEFVLESVGEFLAAYVGVPIDDPDDLNYLTKVRASAECNIYFDISKLQAHGFCR